MNDELSEIGSGSEFISVDNDEQVVGVEDSQGIVLENDDGISQPLSASNMVSNFKDLNDLITNAKDNGVVKLTRDYLYDKNVDSSIMYGITINKSVTIDGQGHTINSDAKRLDITGNNVVLKDIIFKNTRVYSTGNNFEISGCNFRDCIWNGGGAVYSTGADCSVVGCSFVNCSSSSKGDRGAAVFSTGDDCSVVDCSFMNCSSKLYGGAVYSTGADCSVVGCSFADCFSRFGQVIFSIGDNFEFVNCSCVAHSSSYVRNIHSTGDNLKIVNSSFVGCSDVDNGAAVYSWGDNLEIVNCSFINCSTKKSGGAVYSEGADSSVVGSSFVNCSAECDGDAIYFSKGFNLINSSFNNALCYNLTSGNISNVSVNNVAYVNEFDNLKENEQFNLTMNHILLFPISINVNNVIIDGKGKSIVGKLIITGENVTIMNCNFVDCSSGQDSGAVYSSGNNFKIVNCSFVDCSASGNNGHGGAVYSTGDNFELVGCSFMNCSSVYNSGGAVYSSGNNFKIVNCSFVDCSAYNDGGAVYSSGVDCSVAGCSFVNGHAESGGAVYSNGNNFKLLNCSFVDCYGDYGGAVLSSGNNFKLLDCSFVGCSAERGGAVYSCGVDCSVIDCSFIDCSSSDLAVYGDVYGGVVCSMGSNFKLVNCSFVDCHTYDNGGAVYSKGNNFKLTNCSFVGCSAYNDGYGGAVYSSGNNFKLTDCSFVGCSAEMGGAVYSCGVDCSVDGCSFADCSAKYEGDSIYFSKEFKLMNSSFINAPCYNLTSGIVLNVSVDDMAYDCSDFANLKENGHVNLTKDYSLFPISINVNNVIIDGNGKSIGNKLTITGKNVTVRNCNFVDCSGYSGGAIDSSGEDCTVVGCSFLNCSGLYGGAVCTNGNNFKLVDCSFTDCYADDRGGAVYTLRYNFEMVNCSFVDCYADNRGGAVDTLGANFSAVDCSFSGCSANKYGNVVYSAAVNCSFVDCSFAGNSTNVDDFITFKEDSHTIINCTFQKASHVDVSSLIFDYANSYEFDMTLNGANDAHISVVNHPEAIVDVNGNAVSISNLDVGRHILIIATVPDEGYCTVTKSFALKVRKIDSALKVDDVVLDYGNVANVSVETEGSSGVTAKIGDDELTVNANVISIPVLDAGNYVLSVTTVPDANHNAVTKTANVTVNKVNPELTVLAENIAFGESSNITVNLNIDGSVSLQLNQNNYTQMVHDGKTVFSIPGLKVGTYDVKATFLGNENYNPVSVSDAFEVLKVSIGDFAAIDTIKGEDFTLKLPDDATGTLTLTIDGADYIGEVKDGVAYVNLSGLANGNYAVKISYSGDDKYEPLVKTANITFSNVKIVAKDLTMQYSAKNKFTAKVYDADGNLAKNTLVIFKVNGKEVSKLRTKDNGVATYKPVQKPGTYKISITALGKTITKTLKVKQILKIKKVSVKRSAKKLTLTATLSKVNGKYLKNKKITFKFKGKKYVAKTSKKGVAKVTIKSSVLKKLKAGKKVTYSATYLKDTVKKTVKIKK